MDPETRQLTSSTGILTRQVEDLADFAGNPGKYLVDLYADEEAAAKAWRSTGERHHFTYNDGVVTLAWQGAPLLGVPVWDDICGIWSHLVRVVDGYFSAGRGQASFPDQPAPIILEGIRGGALITIFETKMRVDPTIFCRELLDEAERFWSWTDRNGIPVDSGFELSAIRHVRAKIHWS